MIGTLHPTSHVNVSVFFSEWNTHEVLESIDFPIAIQERVKGRTGIGRSQSLSAYALCRRALRLLGVPEVFETITFEPDGKPLLHSNLQFSITHSENKLATAIGNCAVGLDLERRKEIDTTDLEFIFHSKHREEIRRSDNPLITFYDLWTKKESHAKMNGRGIKALNSEESFSDSCHFYPLKISEDFSCTLCTGEALDELPKIIML